MHHSSRRRRRSFSLRLFASPFTSLPPCASPSPLMFFVKLAIKMDATNDKKGFNEMMFYVEIADPVQVLLEVSTHAWNDPSRRIRAIRESGASSLTTQKKQ